MEERFGEFFCVAMTISRANGRLAPDKIRCVKNQKSQTTLSISIEIQMNFRKLSTLAERMELCQSLIKPDEIGKPKTSLFNITSRSLDLFYILPVR